jgi:hypothetical protein
VDDASGLLDLVSIERRIVISASRGRLQESGQGVDPTKSIQGCVMQVEGPVAYSP